MAGNAPFPDEVYLVSARHAIEPALAFGLGEGLNLFYSYRLGEVPSRQLHVLPLHVAERVAARVGSPRAAAIVEAMVGNARGVLVCTGDLHGLDAIERWAEELSRWPLVPGWEQDVAAAVALIRRSDGLYRRSYLWFLELARGHGVIVPGGEALLAEIADNWLDIAERLARGDDLARTGSRILRMAALESRFWGNVLDEFGGGI